VITVIVLFQLRNWLAAMEVTVALTLARAERVAERA